MTEMATTGSKWTLQDFTGNQGIIGSAGSVIGAIGNTWNAYNTWKNGKAQIKAMNRQIDLMDTQLTLENDRYNKRESERLANNALLQDEGEDFSQAIEKQKADLPVNRI